MSLSPFSPPIVHAPGQFVDVGGARLWVEIEGPDDGEPLLLLPGGPANPHLAFHPVFSALAACRREQSSSHGSR